MRKCVTVSCKTGFKLCFGKLDFFIVLNDKNIIRLWKITIFHDDIKLKPVDAIYEKHQWFWKNQNSQYWFLIVLINIYKLS